MSFGAVLKVIGKDALKALGIVESVAGNPLIQAVLPAPFNTIDKLISTAVTTAEATITTAQAGADKKESALSIIESELPNLEEVISLVGPSVSYDAGKLSMAIDAVVAAKNAVSDFVSTVKKT